jgi:hypothetical protein
MLVKPVNDLDLQWIVDKIGGCDLENGPWIAGGAARRLWFGEPWKTGDVDVFFSDPAEFDSAKHSLQKRIVKKESDSIFKPLIDFGSLVIETVSRRKPDAISVYETKNAITYRVNIGKISSNTCDVQLIRRDWHSDLASVWKHFDLTACMFATDGKVIVANEQSVLDCENKILHRNSECSRSIKLSRVIKYSIYGFDAGTDVMNELLQQYKDGTIKENDEAEDYA